MDLDRQPAADASSPAPAPAADAAAAPGKGTLVEAQGQNKEEDHGQPLEVMRTGMVEDADPVPGGDAGLARDTKAGRADLEAIGKTVPQQGGAEELQGGLKTDDVPGPQSEAVNASITEAQQGTKAAIAESTAQADAYKADMKTQRDQFEDQQHATMLEQLKTMSSADKRSTLKELGYSDKDIKKMPDSQIDQIIEGKLEAEQRKTKIMGMDPEELKALGPAQKIQYLVDLGIDKGDLDHIGQQRACQAFDDIMRVAHVPGQHKVNIKIKSGFLGLTGKSWDVTVKCDDQGNTDVTAEAKGGFLSKLWGWIKAALPIILVVLAPLTAGASLIVLAVWQAVEAIKNGDWLGAIIAVAGAIVGVSAFMAVKGLTTAASTFSKIADIASKASKVAQAAKEGLDAAKAKNAGSLLAALAGGAAAFAGFASKSADSFATTMKRWSERFSQWSKIVSGGEAVAKGIAHGDPIGAISGALDTATAAVGPTDGSATQKNLSRASSITNFAGAAKNALKSSPPDYGAVAEAGLGIAGTLREDNKRLADAQKITGAANKLKAAWTGRKDDQAGLAAAALELAEAIQTSKYGNDDKKDGGGDDASGDEDPVQKRYQKAIDVVQAAGAVLTAATAKPRPNYGAAAEAVANLTASLTESKKVELAAQITAKFNAWTAAVNSKDEQAILAAGKSLGESIDGMRKEIVSERDAAKKAAQQKLGQGDVLPDDGGDLPPLPSEPLPLDPTAPLPGEPVPLPSEPLPTDPTAPLPGGSATPLPALLPRLTLRPMPRPDGPTPEPGVEPAPPSAKETPGEGENKDKEKEAEEGDKTAERVLTVIKIFAELKAMFHGETAKTTIEGWESLSDAYQSFKKGGNHAGFQRTVQTITALEATREFTKVVIEDLRAFAPSLANPFNIRATLAPFRTYTKNLGRLVRAAAIPAALVLACEDFLVVCGYDKDGSGKEVSIEDRLEAIKSLGSDLDGIGENIEWMRAAAQLVAQRLGGTEAVSAAVQALKSAAAKYGPEVQDVVMRRLAPVIEKVGASDGAQVAARLSRGLVGEIGEWGTKFAVNAGLREAVTLASSHIGVIIRGIASPEVQILIGVAQLEIDFSTELYASAYQGLSRFFSIRLFGENIDSLKAKIRAKPDGTPAQCDALFRYAFYDFLKNGAYDVHGGWFPYAKQRVPRKVNPTFDFEAAFAEEPVVALTGLVPDIKTVLAAPEVKDAACDYLDQEYKRVFGDHG